ncbi:MAG TPA: GNAT family N-acetyltransferase [Anaeromyxobacteraceae bacterium]|jgi:GNAT superfamily N-acetyltransferase|nr:GNAT family N-acetyltransferase [Anaeromyxobacteraceae bacterium]
MKSESGFAVRAARREDVDALVRLLGVLFSIESDFQPDAARQRRGLALLLDDPWRCAVFVAERAGAVLGMVTAQLVVSTAEGTFSAVVEDMIVDARERGRGVGAALLRAGEAWAATRGATRLQLLADRENRSALGFYDRMGWRPTALVCWRHGGVS